MARCAEAPQQRATALAALGQALSLRSMHEDAGVAYAAAGQLEAALASYRSAGAWQMAMALAGAADLVSAHQQTVTSEQDYSQALQVLSVSTLAGIGSSCQLCCKLVRADIVHSAVAW